MDKPDLKQLSNAVARVHTFLDDRHAQAIARGVALEVADKELSLWLSRLHDAHIELKVTTTDGGNLDGWHAVPHTEHSELYMRSATSKQWYKTDGIACECTAFLHGKPCWHIIGWIVLSTWEFERHEAEREAQEQRLMAEARHAQEELARLRAERRAADPSRWQQEYDDAQSSVDEFF